MQNDAIDFGGRSRLFGSKAGHVVAEVGGTNGYIGQAKSAGFETYASGWHGILIQEVGTVPDSNLEQRPVRNSKRRSESQRRRRAVASVG